MANWYIRESDLDEEYPPRPPFPFGHGSLTCDQITCLKRRLDSSLLVNGGPSTGKTVLAILQAMSLYREGSRCLYIASTSLSLKYAKHAFRTLGLPEQICSSYFEFERSSAKYEVILLDDSHQYSINQIKTLASASHFLLLYGDYSAYSHDIDPHSYDVDPLEEGMAFKEQSLFACKQAVVQLYKDITFSFSWTLHRE